MLRFGVSISCSVLSGMSFAVTDLVPGHLHRKGSLSPSILTRSHSLTQFRSLAHAACGVAPALQVYTPSRSLRHSTRRATPAKPE